MGAINSVPRWSPFVAPPRALPPPTKPPSPRRSRHRSNGAAADKGAHNAASEVDQRDRRMSLSPDAVRDRTYSDGGSVTGMGERSNSKIMGPSAPVLYENALVGEWTSLRARARTHPSEATYVDRRLNAAIHLVCRRQPTEEVVKALLEADPIGANRVTVDGMTPLHFAAYCGAEVEVIRLLLESAEKHPLYSGGGGGLGSTTTAPLQSHNSNFTSQSQPLPPHKSGFGDNIVTASTTDRRGRTPLHLVLSGFRTPHRPDVVRLLLRSDPSGSTRADERGRTPLSLLYDDYAEEVEDALLLSASSSSSSYGGGDAIDDASGGGVGGGNASEGEDVRRMCLDPEGELHECWTMLNVLLRCAYHGTVPEEAIVKREASRADGEGGEEAAEGVGTTPTGSAARRISSSGGLSSHSQAPAQSREIDLLHGPYRPLRAAVGVYETPPKFVRLILRAYPKSAEEKDSDFNLPLHVAARAVPVSHKRSRGRGGRRGSALASAAAMSATTALRGGGQGIGGSGGGGGSTGVVMRGGRNSLLPSSGSGGTLVASSAGLKAKVYNADFGRSGGSGGHHKSIGVGDSSFSSLGGGHGFSSASSSAVAAGTRGSGCGGGAAAHTAISDLLHSYPEAASIPDESGRYALILAVQSGKNWDRDVRPILDAYPEAFYGSRGDDVDGEEDEDEEKGRAAVTRALLGALGSPVGEVRAETTRTATGLAHVWLGGEEDKEKGRMDQSRQGDNASSSSASGDDGDGDDSTAFDDAAAFREEDSATTASNAYADANSYDSPPGEIGRKEGRPLASSSAISLADDLVRLVSTGGGSNGSAHRKGSDLSASLHGSDDWGAGTMAAALDALAGLYANIPRKCLHLPASAEAGSDVAMEALRNEEEEVRESAARCLGAALELQGDEAVLAAMSDLLSQHRAGRGGRQGGMGGPPGGRGITRRFSGSALSVAESIASSITGGEGGGGGGRIGGDPDGDNEESRTDDESDLEEYSSPPSRHGRAAAAYRILLSPSAGATVAKDAEAFRGSTRLIRDLVLDDDVAVRRAACLAAGAALRRSPDPTSTLRELRRAMKKCMRATEEATVHACLARGLISACGNDAKPSTRGGAGVEGGSIFLCKAGMPILDGALMLAVGSAAPPHVQRMFHGFLWLALGVGDARGGGASDGGNNKGLERYKRLAEGENGRIMMTLVNKTLSKIERVEEGDGGQ